MNGRRVLAVLLVLAALALAGFVGLNTSALAVRGFALARAGDVVWTVACVCGALAALAAARRLWAAAE